MDTCQNSSFIFSIKGSGCPFDFSAELRFLKWSVAIHRGPDIRFVFSENCYLLLEEETHSAVHDGHTEKHVLKSNLSKIVIPGLLQE